MYTTLACLVPTEGRREHKLNETGVTILNHHGGAENSWSSPRPDDALNCSAISQALLYLLSCVCHTTVYTSCVRVLE